jgi:outer membrane lipoprotein-sorting protein
MLVFSSEKKESPENNSLPFGGGGRYDSQSRCGPAPRRVQGKVLNLTWFQGWGCPQGGRRLFPIFLISAFSLLAVANFAFSSERFNENRVLDVTQKMEAAFKAMEDYACEVEQLFYQDGVEDQRYRFKFHFKRKKRIRVDFTHPYLGLTIFYNEGDQEATVMPFRFMPGLKFRFSIDNPMIKTSAGQRIDQTDMGYFINFMSKNLQNVRQGEDEFYEDREQVKFLFWAKDYVEEKTLEKYRISISKRHWLPIRIERYSLDGKPLEVTDIKNYIINSRLEDKLFGP